MSLSKIKSCPLCGGSVSHGLSFYRCPISQCDKCGYAICKWDSYANIGKAALVYTRAMVKDAGRLWLVADKLDVYYDFMKLKLLAVVKTKLKMWAYKYQLPGHASMWLIPDADIVMFDTSKAEAYAESLAKRANSKLFILEKVLKWIRK